MIKQRRQANAFWWLPRRQCFIYFSTSSSKQTNKLQKPEFLGSSDLKQLASQSNTDQHSTGSWVFFLMWVTKCDASLTSACRLWSWDYARATTDSMPPCSGNWSWHHHQSATAALQTRRPNMYGRDARFCRQQEQLCGQRQSTYTPNSTAARRNWRRRLHSSRRLDSQCSSDREEEQSVTLQWLKTCKQCDTAVTENKNKWR